MTTQTTDDELLRIVEQNEAVAAEAGRNIKQAKTELLTRRQPEISALLSGKDEPFGDVSIIIGNRKVKVGTPKKVTWEQDKLASAYAEISKAGENPKMYMEVKYSVPETSYKKFPQEVRDFFQGARTVQPGTQTIEIIEE